MVDCTVLYPRTGRRWLRNARCNGPREGSFGSVRSVRSHDQLPSPSLFLNDEPSQSGTLVAAMTLVSGSSASGPGSRSWLQVLACESWPKRHPIPYSTPPRRPVAHLCPLCPLCPPTSPGCPRPRLSPKLLREWISQGCHACLLGSVTVWHTTLGCHRIIRMQGRTWAVWASLWNQITAELAATQSGPTAAGRQGCRPAPGDLPMGRTSRTEFATSNR